MTVAKTMIPTLYIRKLSQMSIINPMFSGQCFGADSGLIENGNKTMCTIWDAYHEKNYCNYYMVAFLVEIVKSSGCVRVFHDL